MVATMEAKIEVDGGDGDGGFVMRRLGLILLAPLLGLWDLGEGLRVGFRVR